MELNFSEITIRLMQSHEIMLGIHARALACHCECLAMNAENMWAAIHNQGPQFGQSHYYQVMEKWGLIDEKGEPQI